MIGNDIVDLALARKESNWKREGFLDKLFNAKEQLLIANSSNPETRVWDLWSRKEAAYKIYNRETHIRAFIPKQLECFDIEIKEGILYGRVLCYDTIYYTQTEITSEYIETNAVRNPADFIKIKTFHSSETIVKTNGIPAYFDSENKIWNPISKSHHGRFERMVTIKST